MRKSTVYLSIVVVVGLALLSAESLARGGKGGNKGTGQSTGGPSSGGGRPPAGGGPGGPHRQPGLLPSGQRPGAMAFGGSPVPAVRMAGRPRADARADLTARPIPGTRPKASDRPPVPGSILKTRRNTAARVQAAQRTRTSPRVRFTLQQPLPNGGTRTRIVAPGGAAPYAPGSRTKALKGAMKKMGLHRGDRGRMLRGENRDAIISAAQLRQRLATSGRSSGRDTVSNGPATGAGQ